MLRVLCYGCSLFRANQKTTEINIYYYYYAIIHKLFKDVPSLEPGGSSKYHVMKISGMSYGKESNAIEVSRYVPWDTNDPWITTTATDDSSMLVEFNWLDGGQYLQNYLAVWSSAQSERQWKVIGQFANQFRIY